MATAMANPAVMAAFFEKKYTHTYTYTQKNKNKKSSTPTNKWKDFSFHEARRGGGAKRETIQSKKY